MGEGDPREMTFGSDPDCKQAKAWKEIWGSGQGNGAIKQVVPASELVARLKVEYAEARRALCQG